MSSSTNPNGDDGAVLVKNRHAPTPQELQRLQLAKLLKDPTKEVHIPKPPQEKALRAPREMMKNVQGSSAGAGSGEFHVYKQSRRREYERLKLMDEEAQKESETAEFERKKREREEAADAKTAKNRAKRQKKKAAKAKAQGSATAADGATAGGSARNKRKLADGSGIKFQRPGEEGSEDEEDSDAEDVGPNPTTSSVPDDDVMAAVPVIDEPKIVIHDD